MKRRAMIRGLAAGAALAPVAALARRRGDGGCPAPTPDLLFRDGFDGDAAVPDVPAYYLPQQLCFIGWDFPSIAHAGIDIDYKLTGYDWFNRPLHWSLVSGPAGMVIDADGTLHWQPAAEGEACVVVRLTAGATVVEKGFAIQVANQRCAFVDGSAGVSGDGSLGSPFRTLLEALATVDVGTGRLVYVRGGLDYEIDGVSWFGQAPGSPYRRVAQGSWGRDDPLILRSFPGEAVRYTFHRGSGFVVGRGVVVMGFELVGGEDVVGENGCLVLGGGAVAKRNIARGYACSYLNNCAGIRFHGGCLLDGNLAYDNYDRGNTVHHNSSNYLFFATSGQQGEPDAFVIDCISGGFSVQGYKIKHAGNQGRLHLHRCVGYGARNAFAGASNRSSVRHSLFYSALPASGGGGYVLGLTATDPSTGGQVHLHEGMLVDRNLVIGDHPESEGLAQATYAFADGYEHPARYQHNQVQISASTAAGHGYITSPWNTLPAQWNAVFQGNRFHGASPGSLLRIGQNTSLPVAHLNQHYGSGNEHAGPPQPAQFQAAGHLWTSDPVQRRLLCDGVVVDGVV